MRFVGALACIAFVISTGTPVRADFIRIPSHQTTTGSPIFITQTSVFVDPNNSSSFRACVSFKNIAPKPANFVTFTFRFDDLLGNPIKSSNLKVNVTKFAGFGAMFLKLTHARNELELLGSTKTDVCVMKMGDPVVV